jgi:hypothetical protein
MIVAPTTRAPELDVRRDFAPLDHVFQFPQADSEPPSELASPEKLRHGR